jgi:hypothetical protein
MRRIVKPFDWVAALFGIPAFGLMLFGLLNFRAFSAGMRNVEAPVPFTEWFMFIAGAILALVGIIFVLATWGRSSNLTRIFGMVVVVLPVFLVIMFLIFPLRMYSRGMAKWAARQVRPAPIREWLAAGTPSAAPPGALPPATTTTASAPFLPFSGAHTLTPPGELTQIPLIDCPADISMLAPQEVWLTKDKRGLLLVWNSGFWGEGRGIFIGIDGASPPPPDIPRWRFALPGVYVSDKVPLGY